MQCWCTVDPDEVGSVTFGPGWNTDPGESVQDLNTSKQFYYLKAVLRMRIRKPGYVSEILVTIFLGKKYFTSLLIGQNFFEPVQK